MCYTGFCCYEVYLGNNEFGCRKPKNLPCPTDDNSADDDNSEIDEEEDED